METAFWRAEVIVVARVLAQQILEERWDVYQPISVVEENLRRSEGRGRASPFWMDVERFGGAIWTLGYEFIPYEMRSHSELPRVSQPYTAGDGDEDWWLDGWRIGCIVDGGELDVLS